MDEIRVQWVVTNCSMLPIVYFYGYAESEMQNFLLVSFAQLIDLAAAYGGKAMHGISAEQIEESTNPQKKAEILNTYPKNKVLSNAMFAIIFETFQKKLDF